MSRRIAVLVGSMAAVVAVVVLALGLLETEMVGAPGSTSAARPEALRAELPSFQEAGTPTELSLPAAVDPDAAPSDTAQAAAASAPPGDQLTFNGTVVDETGSPIEGALVFFVPDARTLAAGGAALVGGSYLAGASVTDFPSTHSDAEGRFSLEARCLRSGPSDEPVLKPRWPCVVASASGFAPWVHEVVDLREERDDLGLMRLVRGGWVRGRVVDDRGLGLEGALVTLGICEGWPRDRHAPRDLEPLLHGTQTAEGGHFELTDLPATRLQSAVTAAGMLPGHWEPFDLAGGSLHTLPDMVLSRGHAVSGTVVDPAGRPVANAEVVSVRVSLSGRATGGLERQLRLPASSLRGEVATTTDDAGRFSLAGIPRTPTSLRARSRGFAATLAHDVEAGADVVLQLAEPAVLGVRVVDSVTRAPLAAAIEARPLAFFAGEPDPEGLEIQGAGEVGSWRVIDAGGAGTVLSVRAPGHASVELTAPGVSAAGRGDITIELVPGCSLRGQVTDMTGLPVPAATVRLLQPMPGNDLAATLSALGYADAGGSIRSVSDSPARVVLPGIPCDTQGRFTLEEFAPGTYLVEARAPACVTTRTEPIECVAGQPGDDVLIRLPPAGDVRGLVLDATGASLPRFEVEMQSPHAERTLWTQCDTAGRFFFRDMTPGAWDVLTRGGGAATVVVVAGELAEVVVQLPPPAVLEVEVLAGTRPVPGIEVTGNTAGMPLLISRTDAHGVCRFELPAGLLRVSVETPGGGALWRQADLAAGESRRLVFELPAGGLDVLVRDAATAEAAVGVAVAAVLLDPNGQWKGLDFWEDPLERSPVTTGPDGRARIEHLELGTWEVHAGGRGWTCATPARTEVGAGAASLVLEVRRAPVIHGRVQHADGRPAARTTVRFLRLPSPEEPAGGQGFAGEAMAVTEQDGGFLCETLDAAGTWVVLVPRRWRSDSLEPEAVLAKSEVQVEAGQTLEVVLTLPDLP